MATGSIKLNILSPEKTLFSGDVASVSLPGLKAPFVVLYNHAPIMSVLNKGFICWSGNNEGEVAIAGGFVEVKDNEVTVCVEV
ncbi:MAG: F0F1 ATP synthase subunit epsilon [Bacteroidaceae bacterium]|nr:F0F1 ATP synthase subunit epsilon [Bacteroidaceae bacterium]